MKNIGQRPLQKICASAKANYMSKFLEKLIYTHRYEKIHRNAVPKRLPQSNKEQSYFYNDFCLSLI